MGKKKRDHIDEFAAAPGFMFLFLFFFFSHVYHSLFTNFSGHRYLCKPVYTEFCHFNVGTTAQEIKPGGQSLKLRTLVTSGTSVPMGGSNAQTLLQNNKPLLRYNPEWKEKLLCVLCLPTRLVNTSLFSHLSGWLEIVAQYRLNPPLKSPVSVNHHGCLPTKLALNKARPSWQS